ncbi:sugar efflux transporter for intercellular exchange-domain-containing protein [Entophlyctis helioformis]|nr:sugar efflux transporter for intercellular exchange-domain-containing protein [Entophlyctis helioformis]
MATICTSQACEVVLRQVVPGIGVVTALLIFIAPYKSVKQIEETKSLSSVNAFPFPMIIANCLCWIVYGLLVQDAFVFGPNIVGYPLGVFYTLTAFKYGDASFRSHVQMIIIAASVFIFSGAFLSFIVLKAAYPARLVMGSVCVIVLSIFYGSPLSSIYAVIKARDSTPIDVMLAIASFVNGMLWTLYGVAVGDAFIWAPNLLGVVFCLIQFALLVVFPKQSEPDGFAPLRSNMEPN